MNAADHLPNPRRGRTQATAGDDDDAPHGAPAYRGDGACSADRCPCRGTTIREGRSWCTWHARAAGEAFMGLSDRLVEQRDLIDLVGELGNMHRFAGKGRGEAWVHRARRFFAADEHMHPSEHERQHIGGYLWRLIEEIAYRVGVEAKRPQPQTPLCRDPAWMSDRQRAIAEAAQGAKLPQRQTPLQAAARASEYAQQQGIAL